MNEMHHPLYYASPEDCTAEYLKLSESNNWEMRSRRVLSEILTELIYNHPDCHLYGGKTSRDPERGKINFTATLKNIFTRNDYETLPPGFIPVSKKKLSQTSTIINIMNWIGSDTRTPHTYQYIHDREKMLDLLLYFSLYNDEPNMNGIDRVNGYLGRLDFQELYLLKYADFCAMVALKLHMSYVEYRDMLDRPQPTANGIRTRYIELADIYMRETGHISFDLVMPFSNSLYRETNEPTQYYFRSFEKLTRFGSAAEAYHAGGEGTVCSFYRRFCKDFNRIRVSSYSFLNRILAGSDLGDEWLNEYFPTDRTPFGVRKKDTVSIDTAWIGGSEDEYSIRFSDVFSTVAEKAAVRWEFRQESMALARARENVFSLDDASLRNAYDTPNIELTRVAFLKRKLVATEEQREALHEDCVRYARQNWQYIVGNAGHPAAWWRDKENAWLNARHTGQPGGKNRRTIFDETGNALELCWKHFLLWKASVMTEGNHALQEEYFEELANRKVKDAGDTPDYAVDFAEEVYHLRSVSRSTVLLALLCISQNTLISLLVDDPADFKALLEESTDSMIASDIERQINFIFTGRINEERQKAGLGYSELRSSSSPVEFLLLAAIHSTDYHHLSQHPYFDFVRVAVPGFLEQLFLP